VNATKTNEVDDFVGHADALFASYPPAVAREAGRISQKVLRDSCKSLRQNCHHGQDLRELKPLQVISKEPGDQVGTGQHAPRWKGTLATGCNATKHTPRSGASAI
jgi:hypothetical protein